MRSRWKDLRTSSWSRSCHGVPTVTFTEQATSLSSANDRKVIDTAESARAPGLSVELGGQAIGQVGRTPTSSSELIGIIAAGIVLFIAFGSLAPNSVCLDRTGSRHRLCAVRGHSRRSGLKSGLTPEDALRQITVVLGQCYEPGTVERGLSGMSARHAAATPTAPRGPQRAESPGRLPHPGQQSKAPAP
jgi:hypothetical protein